MELNKDVVPSTIEAAVQLIINSLMPEERDFILASGNSVEVHHTIGQYLRNSWSLWEPDSPLKRDAALTYGIAHPDDISGLILSWVYAKVRNEPFDPGEEVAGYLRHWAAYGTDALTAGNWPPPGETI